MSSAQICDLLVISGFCLGQASVWAPAGTGQWVANDSRDHSWVSLTAVVAGDARRFLVFVALVEVQLFDARRLVNVSTGASSTATAMDFRRPR
jgi:hypothetical protein